MSFLPFGAQFLRGSILGGTYVQGAEGFCGQPACRQRSWNGGFISLELREVELYKITIGARHNVEAYNQRAQCLGEEHGQVKSS